MKVHKILLNSLFFLIKLCFVIIICFFMFLIIPLIKHFSDKPSDNITKSVKNQVIAEYIKLPDKVENTKFQSKIREVRISSSHSARQSLDFKFTPDFDIEGSGDIVAVNSSPDLSAVIFEEGQADENAEPVNRPAIPYPQRARELGIEGDLVMVLIVGTDGKVLSIDIIDSPDQSFAKSAKKIILSSWKFKPAKNQGIPVKQRLKQKISFRLDE